MTYRLHIPVQNLGGKIYNQGKTNNSQILSKNTITGELNLENLSHVFPTINRDCHNLRSNNCMLSLPKPRTNALKKVLDIEDP